MKKKILILLAVTVMIMFTLSGCGSKTADTVITGKIYTSDKNDSTVQAVAFKDGKITYAGDKKGAEEYTGNDTKKIDTGDGIAMPSFIEAHAHGQQGGVEELYEVNLYEGTSYKEYLQTVKAFVKDHKNMKFIKGSGWINGYAPASGPKASDLDKICKDIPIAIVSGDHHSYWVNSKCMELMKVDKNTKDVKGGVIERDSQGNPTGCFRDTAQKLVDKAMPDFSVKQYKKGILAYQNEVKAYGVTAYYEPMVNLNGSKNLLKAYNELDDNDGLVIKVYGGYQIIPTDNQDKAVAKAKKAKEDAKGGNFEITSVKLLTDGVVEGHTAYLTDKYSDAEGGHGERLFTQKQLNSLCLKVNKAGMAVHAHCIGDAATTETLNAFQYVKDKTGKTNYRNAITHLQVVNKNDFSRMAKLKVIAVTNPYWFFKEAGYFNEVEMPYLGKKRANNEYPEKSFFDAGCVVTSGSDYPVTLPPRPLDAIQTAVTRCDLEGDKATLQNPSQRVTVEQMMKSFTYNGAYQNFDEKNTGSIKVGKNADIVILSRDIKKVDPYKISKIKVTRTIWKGKTIYHNK